MIKKGEQYITIQGAKMHNLKNVSVKIPRNKLTVITGVSGSGKSSLAFDTLYAEGQRRYVESLSSYARQFMGKLEKPDVDKISGLSPAIAIEQKVSSRSSRSTVGTTTEIFDYCKLLFARIGKTISPISGKEVKRHTVDDVLNDLSGLKTGTEVIILAPMVTGNRSNSEQLKIYNQQGFARIYLLQEGFKRISDCTDEWINERPKDEIKIAVDRLQVSDEGLDASRCTDGINTAFFEGLGTCEVLLKGAQEKVLEYSNRFELDGMLFEEPSDAFFSFNNPYGACGTCEGFGSIIGIDSDLVIPDTSLSVYNDAVVCWRGEKMSEWKHQLIRGASSCNFPIHRPIEELNKEEYDLLWKGNRHFKGINQFFKKLEEKAYKIQNRVMLSRYRGKTPCPDCQGSRIRKDAHYVKINGQSIMEILKLPVADAKTFFDKLELSDFEKKVADRLLLEISNRLKFLLDVGLGYLTLDRLSSTLSGGESQRINLATSLGSSLVGSTYILDEPSIGLHPRDNLNLIAVLKRLRDIGNTVVVVEHDEEIMRQADYIVDMGPQAGSNGGEVCFQGPLIEIYKAESITGKYLAKNDRLQVNSGTSNARKWIKLKGAKHNNLKNIDVQIPLNHFTVITGVSGSGKSSLIRDILFPSLGQKLGIGTIKPGKHLGIEGNFSELSAVEYIDQNPIGKSSRSNPVTYVKAYDEIRSLFSNLAYSKSQGFKPAQFSFNVSGGRCDECEGEGVIKIEMQFMADVHLTCESCGGTRFKEETLEAKYRGHSIFDVLNLTVDQALAFFNEEDKLSVCKKIVTKLNPLAQVGLGYLKLGQASNTLSGGEAQRIKLASYLSKGSSQKPILFLFDEPTTGLHFYDIENLLNSFKLLIERGHSILCIEHNLDLIRCADWLIDIGPEGGASGGNLVYEGPISGIKEVEASHTGKHLFK